MNSNDTNTEYKIFEFNKMEPEEEKKINANTGYNNTNILFYRLINTEKQDELKVKGFESFIFKLGEKDEKGEKGDTEVKGENDNKGEKDEKGEKITYQREPLNKINNTMNKNKDKNKNKLGYFLFKEGKYLPQYKVNDIKFTSDGFNYEGVKLNNYSYVSNDDIKEIIPSNIPDSSIHYNYGGKRKKSRKTRKSLKKSRKSRKIKK